MPRPSFILGTPRHALPSNESRGFHVSQIIGKRFHDGRAVCLIAVWIRQRFGIDNMNEPSAEVSCGQRPGEEMRMMTGKESVVGNYDRLMKSEKTAKDI